MNIGSKKKSLYIKLLIPTSFGLWPSSPDIYFMTEFLYETAIKFLKAFALYKHLCCLLNRFRLGHSDSERFESIIKYFHITYFKNKTEKYKMIA